MTQRMRTPEELQAEINNLGSIRERFIESDPLRLNDSAIEAALLSEISTILAIFNWIRCENIKGVEIPSPSKHIQNFLDRPERQRIEGGRLIIPV